MVPFETFRPKLIAALIGPCQDSVACEFAAIVADNHLRPVALDNEAIQFPRHARMRKRRPSVSWSETKSRLQRSLGANGIIIGALVPIARLRPPRRRTASFSSR